jgi:hypothetical protein
MQSRARAFLATGLALLASLAVSAVEAAGADFVINELMPRNDSWDEPAFLDEDGSKQGWIEIKNTTGSAASLLGWSLATDAAGLDRWIFPDVSVDPGASVVVWLSGKDRAQAGAALHTDFTAMRGEDCFLFDAQLGLADAIEDTSIPLDNSFGRCHDTNAPGYYYNVPSPGAENDEGGHSPFVVLEEHVSLEVGVPHTLQVWPDTEVIWESDNPSVSVSSSGVLYANQDALAPGGRALITARLPGHTFTDAIDVTIVDWVASASTLEIAAIPDLDAVLGQDEAGIYFAIGADIYRSEDGLETRQLMGTFPITIPSSAGMLVMPFGYLIRANQSIYHSTDLSSWTLVFQTQHPGLQHAFDAYYDEGTQTGYVYAGEYSSQSPETHHQVYRGTFPSSGAPTWQTLLDFTPIADWEVDPSITTAVRHVHVVSVDPYTGHVYVATGDVNEHSRIYFSDDNGDSFQLLGMGDQSLRTLAIWFTPDYVYWNMDTTAPQSIWRVPRTAYQPGVGWSEDPLYDDRELVAELINGSQWYQGFALSDAGDVISLVGAAAEGELRDRRGRLFGIKEGPGGAAIVQELHSLSDEGQWLYRQLIPLAQDAAGFVYLRGRSTAHEFYQARLVWYDDAASVPTGGPVPPTPPAVCVTPLPEPGSLWSLAALLPALALLHQLRVRRARSGETGSRP